MAINNSLAVHSDTEVLNRIEDFLVNHFGIEQRRDMSPGTAFEMLEHIADLIELRRGNSQKTCPAGRDRTSRLGDVSEK
jgi:hypothetical protein